MMHVDGAPIEGLCAVGEIAGGVHGAGRLGSCATLDCLAFGCVGQCCLSGTHKNRLAMHPQERERCFWYIVHVHFLNN